MPHLAGLNSGNFEVICVSAWHADQAAEMMGSKSPISRVYNPLPDYIYEIGEKLARRIRIAIRSNWSGCRLPTKASKKQW